jgi:uncharacterized protein (DUF1330 family)
MSNNQNETYLEVTQEAGKEFVMRGIQGSIVMLNLLRFREVADYSAAPHLAPQVPISGEAAYQLYIENTLPHLKKSGGEIVFMGTGGPFLIGPTDERWDAVLLVRQSSVNEFLAFASNPDYTVGLAHRTAALEDSRLLPMIEDQTTGTNAEEQ